MSVGGDTVVGVGHCYDDYFDVIGSYRGHPIVEEICSTSAALRQTWRALLYVCEFSNVEVILAENNAKVANWYKVYMREGRRILFSLSTFFVRVGLMRVKTYIGGKVRRVEDPLLKLGVQFVLS